MTPEIRKAIARFTPPCLLPRMATTLWGQPRHMRPALVKQAFGDGKQLIVLQTLYHRPNHYLVRIGGNWQLANDADTAAGPRLCDHIDEIYSAISDEFGDELHTAPSRHHWPELNTSCGSHWYEAELDDIISPKRKPRHT